MVDLSGKYSLKYSPLQTLVIQHKFNILINVLVTFHLNINILVWGGAHWKQRVFYGFL